MKCLDYRKIEGVRVQDPTVAGVTMRIAAGPDDGAPNFTMRVFTVEPGGYTPHHAHDFEHEIFFHEGAGEVQYEDWVVPVASGYAAFVPPNVKHQIRNTGDRDLVFICVVPKGI